MDEHAQAVKARAGARASGPLLLLWACVFSHAHAQQPAAEPAQTGTSVAYVRLSDCGAPPWTRDQGAELLRALALELRSDGIDHVRAVEGGAENTTPLLELDVDCASTAEFALRADSAPGVEPSHRRMDLRDVPEPLRPRALALAIAELLRTSRRATPPASSPGEVEPGAGTQPSASTADSPAPSDAAESTPATETHAPASVDATAQGAASANAPPASPAASPAPRPDAAGEPKHPEPRHALSIALKARLLLASSDVLYGIGAGWEWLRLGAGLDALFGQASDTLGTTHFGLVHAVLSYQVLRLRLGRQVLHVGPALGAGITWASAASSASANGGSALLLSYEVGARLGVSRNFASGLAAGLLLEAGYAHGPRLRADDRDLATLSGAFLGLGLHVSMGL